MTPSWTQDRIAAFVMLDGMTGKTQAEKTMRLRLVGFGNAEIAAMLQTTPAVVASNLYAERKQATKKAPAKKGAPAEDSAAWNSPGRASSVVRPSGGAGGPLDGAAPGD